MESTDSSAAGGPHHQQQQAAPPQQQPHLPPGFRFHPTDEELVVHYLKRKAQSAPLPVSIIAEVDLYKFDPWELPAKAVFGEQEWYFFSPRDRKYPNGARPNRAATSGYWKATGTDKPVMSSVNQKVGVKKALVFYGGKPPRGVKTNWIMHEYRLTDTKPNNKPPGYDHCNNKKGSLRLDDWVLCRIYKKNNAHRPMEQDRDQDSMEEMMMMNSISMGSIPTSIQNQFNKPAVTLNYTSLLDHQGMYEGMMDTSSLSHHLPSASTTSSGPLKRALPSLYWGPGNEQDSLSSGKKPNNHSNDERVERNIDHENNNDNDNNNNNNMGTIASLLNQLPAQTPPLHQQSMLGGLQPYLSGLNWYS